jgi:hypothetical protein
MRLLVTIGILGVEVSGLIALARHFHWSGWLVLGLLSLAAALTSLYRQGDER